ncbi:MAG: hypothetical protein GY938_16450 [Ketobacter sp.]|nr:hypothetical protein [Ketobacter sp.]
MHLASFGALDFSYGQANAPGEQKEEQQHYGADNQKNVDEVSQSEAHVIFKHNHRVPEHSAVHDVGEGVVVVVHGACHFHQRGVDSIVVALDVIQSGLGDNGLFFGRVDSDQQIVNDNYFFRNIIKQIDVVGLGHSRIVDTGWNRVVVIGDGDAVGIAVAGGRGQLRSLSVA